MSEEYKKSNELETNELETNEEPDEEPDEDDEVSEYNSESDDDSEDELMEEGDDDFKVIDFTNTYENMVKKEKKTLPIMSKFEKARIIGVRAQQIADGAVPTVKVPDKMISVIEIAKLELKERRLPLIIRRILTKNKYEDWRIDEFELIV